MSGVDHTLSAADAPLFDPTAPLTATGNLRRRAIVSRLAAAGASVSQR